MKFYDSIGLPNPDGVKIALAEKAVLGQVEITQVNLGEVVHRTEAFKAKNPTVAAPLLELDCGIAISETTTTIEYIDHAFEGIRLKVMVPMELTALQTGAKALQRAQAVHFFPKH